MAFVKDIQFEAGNLIVQYDSGPPRRYPVGSFVNAASVPDLNISSLTLLTKLAQVMIVLVRTLQEAGILDEEFIEGFDYQYVRETLVNDLAAEEV